MIAAAHRLFSERGFDGASMDAIAAEAGVSKPTVYRHFESKESLFDAALESALEQLPSAEAMVFDRRGPLRQRLVAIAHDALLLATGPLMASLQRMLTLPMDSASCRAGRLWDAKLQHYLDAMRRLLESEHSRGALWVNDSARAASHFVSLIVGEPMVRLFLTGEPPVAARDVDHHVATAVDAFLRAYACVRD
jgi:TetR/AcrR family transcriptional repressor of mexJK operon